MVKRNKRIWYFSSDKAKIIFLSKNYKWLYKQINMCKNLITTVLLSYRVMLIWRKGHSKTLSPGSQQAPTCRGSKPLDPLEILWVGGDWEMTHHLSESEGGVWFRPIFGWSPFLYHPPNVFFHVFILFCFDCLLFECIWWVAIFFIHRLLNLNFFRQRLFSLKKWFYKSVFLHLIFFI